MRILLTNDDGLTAPGLVALHEELLKLGEVFTVAPHTVQSATSHGVTFNLPLMVHEVQVNQRLLGYSVDGRPADCVKIAIDNLWPEHMGGRPDLVVSGMNMGCNVGIHVCYSGTVGAAIEAAFLGLPAIAVSLYVPGEFKVGGFRDVRWDVAARHARETIERCLGWGSGVRGQGSGGEAKPLSPSPFLPLSRSLLEPGSVLNINLPRTDRDGPRPPMRVVPMNLAAMQDRFEKRISPAGQVYYWVVGDGMEFHETAEGSDLEAMLAGAITVTPLHYDLTDHRRLAAWRDRLEEVEPQAGGVGGRGSGVGGQGNAIGIEASRHRGIEASGNQGIRASGHQGIRG